MARLADPERDAAACAGIYAPHVDPGPASFEARAPGAGEMGRRIAATLERLPWLVAERDGEVAGYAYAATHRDRAAYRWAVDVAVYVGDGHRRHGVARELYGELLPLLARLRLRVACAGITLPNDASVGLHEAFGFRPVGVYRGIGHKAGSWRDVGWWQLALGDGTTAEPEEPLALPELR